MIFTVLKARGKRALADVICYCKMASIIALDGVTSFLRLKDLTNTCKRMQHIPTIGGKAESWKMLKISNVFSSFIVC